MTTQPVTYFAGRPELQTSYTNQRQLAARDLGQTTTCYHGQPLNQACLACRTSGCVLLPRVQDLTDVLDADLLAALTVHNDAGNWPMVDLLNAELARREQAQAPIAQGIDQAESDSSTGRLTRAFRAQGYDNAQAVLVNPHGYAVTVPTRAEAFSLARAVLNSFEADPEAGLPSVTVKAPLSWRGVVGYVVRVTHAPTA